LTACASPWATTTAEPIGELRLPGVQEVPALFNTERQTSIESAEIMTAVTPVGSSGSVEFIFSLGRQLYAVSLSETEAHPLYPKTPCVGGDAYLSDLTRDGAWFGCGQGEGIDLVKLSTDPSVRFPLIKIDNGCRSLKPART
jgi:hypothetical protein